MTTAFSQRDPRWAGARLGTSALTVGEAGCLVSALASVLADWGADTDPGRLNAWLAAHGGYAGGGRLVFGAVEPLGARLRAWVDCYATPANLGRIARALAAGWGILALVDARPGAQVQAHWVRVLQIMSGPRGTAHDCAILDPWQLPGRECTCLLAHYGARGWSAGRAIFVFVGYERVSPADGAGAARCERPKAPAVRVQAVVHRRRDDG